MTPVIIDINVNNVGSVVVKTVGKSVSAFIMDIDEVVSGNADSRGARFTIVT